MPKDIAVRLTGSAEDGTRLAHAAQVAEIFDAHLTGLLQHLLPQLVVAADPSGASYMQTALTEANAAAQLNFDRAKASFEQLSVSHELRQVEAMPGAIGNALAAEVRLCDLFVGTRPYGSGHEDGRVEETVLFKSGRGCLLVPPGAAPPTSYDHVMVAWKNTREAARALGEAMPFLKRAEQVTVALVEEGGASEEAGRAPGADIGRHLSRHGVMAEIRAINGWSDAGEALHNEARQLGVQLLVMGGYGHSRFREWLLGGATRHLLSEAEFPILTAH